MVATALSLCLVFSRLSDALQTGGVSSLINKKPRIRRILPHQSKVVQSATITEPKKTDTFQWTKHWYPLAVTEFLDPEKPHAIKLMGRDFVIWNDGKAPGATSTTSKTEVNKGLWRKNENLIRQPGAWRCFEDACPHRGVPLSEGRVELTGELLCAYHAWRFDGSGACTAIPQAPQDTHDSIVANPRSSCASFPTKECDGILFVWPENGPDAALEAALQEPALVPQLHDPELEGRVKKLAWNTRHLPYGWDYFMENVMDPAHVVVSHHNIIGSRYTGPEPMNLEVARPVTADGGFKFDIIPESGMGPLGGLASNDFRPPSLLQITTKRDDGSQNVLALYCVPTTPGKCFHIGCQVLVSPNVKEEKRKGVGRVIQKAQNLVASFAFFQAPIPTWLNHVLAALFLNQDAVFIHEQERKLAKHGYKAQPGGGNYAEAVFTPTESDKNVIVFRQWLAQLAAGGGVPWPQAGASELPAAHTGSQSAVFDVYESHVKDCRLCQDALRNTRRVRAAAFVAAGAIAVFGSGLGAASGAAACAGVGCVAGKLIGLFHRYEFSHSDNN